jgi:ABC-type branched-subunit amino acid transport system substrate-binding protein
MDRLKALEARPTLQLVMGLGGLIVALVLVGIIGAFAVGNDSSNVKAAKSSPSDGTASETTLPAEGPGAAETSTTVAAGVAATPKTTKAGAAPVKTVGGSGIARNDLVSAPGATRTGVSATSVRWGIHAPQTFGSIPVDFAKNPIEGVNNYIDYLNKNGGVNGRKIEQKVFNDKYTVDGAKTAADDMIDGYKPFIASGTLGVDQVAIVAARAQNRGVPYIAGGGAESQFKSMGLFQQAASYDTHLVKLAEYLGKQSKTAGSPYFNLKKVGVSRLDSDYIKPAVETSFRNALTANGMELVADVTVQKPTDQTNYSAQLSELKSKGTEIFVPAQDPLTTSREVKECAAQACSWKYAGSNFAHESNTALKLMSGQWTGARWLAGACYYLDARAADASKCGPGAKRAHDEWVAQKGESDWNDKGQDGSAGYQLVHIWLKALRDSGSDPTREKFVAALKSYSNYDDLVSSPITYAGKSTFEHGAEKLVEFEAGATEWKQVGPGFVDHF